MLRMMKRVCVLLGGLFFALYCASTQAQTFSDYEYPQDDSNIANPDRGFYHHAETLSGAYSPLNEATLRAYRADGITLILRLFYLNDFVDSPISEQYLASMQKDFNTARAAGVKTIVRFAYTKRSTAPYGDATPEVVISHIKQLAPVLQNNKDVIAVVQAGFIGAWGEWYYTDHFSETLGAPIEADWVNRRALINALLEAVPEGRAVQVRTPAIKFALVQSEQALQESGAFVNTPAARLGHHNDCFLASSTDYGTYTSNIEQEKAFLEQETRFLPMGGETCGISVPLSECPNAVAQMERFHWSYLNRDYHAGVLGSWETGDCLPDVFRKLGYRFRLTESRLQQQSKPGGVLNFEIELLNDGWANPYNERPVEVVLKETLSGKIVTLPLQEDPRRWPQNDTIKLNIEAGLPTYLPEGEYEAYLNFPAPERSVRDNPDYSIRLANSGTWDPETGFNKLNHRVSVSRQNEVPDYTGTRIFFSKPEAIEFTAIANDGNESDWQNVLPVATVGSLKLAAFNDRDSVYFLLSGIEASSFEIFIDVDVFADAGFLAAPWNTNYPDYKITPEGLFAYGSGTWSLRGNSNVKTGSTVTEVSVLRGAFDIKPMGTSIEMAAVINTTTTSEYLPSADQAFALYNFFLETPPSVKATSSGDNVILYWPRPWKGEYLVIERGVNGSDFEKITVSPATSFTHIEIVAENTAADFRSYIISESGRNVSAYSQPVTVQTSARPEYYVFTPDGDPDEWEGVVPLGTAWHGDTILAYRMFVTATNLLVLFEGAVPDEYAFYFDTDNSSSTGSAGGPWSYTGFDYVITNDSLLRLESGAPGFVSLPEVNSTPGYLELSVPLSDIDLNENTVIYTAATVKVGPDTLDFPFYVESPLRFLRTLPAPAPAVVTVSNSENLPETQLIVQWQACAGCKGYIVERGESESGPFVTVGAKNQFTFSHFDDGLVTGTTYYYRVFSYNDAGLSVPSAVVSGTPQVVTSVYPESGRGVMVYPNPFDDFLAIDIPASGRLRVELLDINGQVLWTKLVTRSGLLIDEVRALRPGVYFLKVWGTDPEVFRVIRR